MPAWARLAAAVSPLVALAVARSGSPQAPVASKTASSPVRPSDAVVPRAAPEARAAARPPVPDEKDVCGGAAALRVKASPTAKPFTRFDPPCPASNPFCDTVDRPPNPKDPCFVAAPVHAWDKTTAPQHLDKTARGPHRAARRRAPRKGLGHPARSSRRRARLARDDRRREPVDHRCLRATTKLPRPGPWRRRVGRDDPRSRGGRRGQGPVALGLEPERVRARPARGDAGAEAPDAPEWPRTAEHRARPAAAPGVGLPGPAALPRSAPRMADPVPVPTPGREGNGF